MFGISPKWIIAGVAAAAIGLIITLSFKHYTGLLEDVETLTASNAQLQVAIEIEKSTSAAKDSALLDWQMAAEQSQLENEQLAIRAKAASAEVRRLNAIFAEHDLTRLTLAKPGLIERRINSGTARIGRLLECASSGECDSDGGSSGTD